MPVLSWPLDASRGGFAAGCHPGAPSQPVASTGRDVLGSELSPARLGAGSRPVRRPCPAPASPKGPAGPTPRANPFPEVTDLICRLPLPTLIYRLEAIHLGDLLRIWVRTRPKVRDGVLGVRQPRREGYWPQLRRHLTGLEVDGLYSGSCPEARNPSPVPAV